MTIVSRTLDRLAHDLRNDSNVIVNGVRLLAADDPTGIADDMSTSARALAVVVDRLIEAARAERDTGDAALDSVQLHDVIDAGVRRSVREWRITPPDNPVGAGGSRVETLGHRAERVVADMVAVASWDGTAATIDVDAQSTLRVAAAPTVGNSEPRAQHAYRAALIELAKAIAPSAGIDLECAAAGAFEATLVFRATPPVR